MFSTSNKQQHQKNEDSLVLEKNDKFFSRLLSKESSVPSFRIYATAPASVPFVWELLPGTPKHPAAVNMSSSTLLFPPLTPPPSHHNNLNMNGSTTDTSTKTKSSLIKKLFSSSSRRSSWARRRSCGVYPSTPKSTCSSFNSSMSCSKYNRVYSSASSRFSFVDEEEDLEREDLKKSPYRSETACFGGRFNRKSHSMREFKNVFFNVAHKSIS